MSASGEHWKVWGQYVAIAGAYAACYEVTLHLSTSHWLLTAGLRLACLLLVPVRYWSALAFGEFLPLLENALLCMGQFGGAWALAASVPTIVLYMAWLKPMRARWGLHASNGMLHMGYLVTAALFCALTNALRDTAAVLVILTSSTKDWGPNVSLSIAFSAYMLGAYLGALTITPVILAIQERVRNHSFSPRLIAKSQLFRDIFIWLLPVLGLLCWWANATTDDVQQHVRLAMILPVALMAYRHGWHGTAIAGLFASIAMAMTSHVTRDPAVIHCQVALAAALSLGLLLAKKPWWTAEPQSTTAK